MARRKQTLFDLFFFNCAVFALLLTDIHNSTQIHHTCHHNYLHTFLQSDFSPTITSQQQQQQHGLYTVESRSQSLQEIQQEVGTVFQRQRKGVETFQIIAFIHR
jgi:hypothetical protein